MKNEKYYKIINTDNTNLTLGKNYSIGTFFNSNTVCEYMAEPTYSNYGNLALAVISIPPFEKLKNFSYGYRADSVIVERLMSLDTDEDIEYLLKILYQDFGDKRKSWTNISSNLKLSINIMDKYSDKLDWEEVSYQELNESFVLKHAEKFDLLGLKLNDSVPYELFKKVLKIQTDIEEEQKRIKKEQEELKTKALYDALPIDEKIKHLLLNDSNLLNVTANEVFKLCNVELLHNMSDFNTQTKDIKPLELIEKTNHGSFYTSSLYFFFGGDGNIYSSSSKQLHYEHLLDTIIDEIILCKSDNNNHAEHHLDLDESIEKLF